MSTGTRHAKSAKLRRSGMVRAIAPKLSDCCDAKFPHAAPTELGWGFGWAAGYKHGAPNGALRDASSPNDFDTQLARKAQPVFRPPAADESRS